jgi:hypothetical protein
VVEGVGEDWGGERGEVRKWRVTREKKKERFLSAQADHSAGAEWKEKASACSVRNDGVFSNLK